MRSDIESNSNRKLAHYIFFVFIILGIVYLFKDGYKYKDIPLINDNGRYFLFGFIGLYIFSHFLRAVRLYTLLLEEKVNFKDLLAVYFITAWSNFVVPYKLGELFKISEIGYLCKSIRKGIVTVWIERFFDALVLISLLIFYISLSASYSFSVYMPVVIVLFLFISFSLLYYIEFPFTYKYLNLFFISKSSSYRGVKILKLIHDLKIIHCDIKALIRGRSSLLLFFSVFIWFIEILAISTLSSAVNIHSLVNSFFILINDSLIPTNNLGSDVIALYKYAALLVLSALTVCLLILNLRKRIRGIINNEKIKQNYKINEIKFEEQSGTFQ